MTDKYYGLSEEAALELYRKKKREYMRQWRKRNKERAKEMEIRSWVKKALEEEDQA